jgi:hypothetical protein
VSGRFASRLGAVRKEERAVVKEMSQEELKAIIGMKTALNIKIEPVANGTTVDAGVGIFGQQANSYGDHLAGILAGNNRAGMEHGPGVQAGRGGYTRHRREPESPFGREKRGDRGVTKPKRGDVLSQEAAPTFCPFCCLASAFVVFQTIPHGPPSCPYSPERVEA